MDVDRNKWSEEDFRLLFEEMEELRYENHKLRIQRDIDDLQRQIDQTLSKMVTSTPGIDETGMGDTSRGRSYEDETPHKPVISKPRRILPSIPRHVKSNAEDINDRFVTQRRRMIDPQKTGDRRNNMSQTVDIDAKPASKSMGSMVKPAKYDGSTPWTDYKAHFDACATLNEWSEKQKGLYLFVSLRGQAQGVFGNISSKATEYSDLVQALEERFSPKNQTELHRVELKDRRQRATESMSQLGQDIRRLANLAYPIAPIDVRDTLAKEQFIDALINSDMRLKIKQTRPVDLNDAVRHAVELESFYRSEKMQQGVLRATNTGISSTEGHDLREVISDLKKSVDDMKRQNQYRYTQNTSSSRWPGSNNTQRGNFRGRYPRQNRYAQNRSWRSDRNIYRQENSDMTLKGAEKESSASENKGSNSAKPTQKSENDSQSIHSSRHLMAGLYANAMVDKMSVDCLVDTGATLTIISENLWSTLKNNKNLAPFHLPITSASGDLLTIKGHTEINLFFNEHSYQIKAVVAEIGTDIVLGLDFVQQHGIVIDVINHKMKMKEQVVDLFCTGKIGCFRIVVSEQITIPPESEMIVRGKVVEPGIERIGYGIVEASEAFQELGNALVARSIVQAITHSSRE